jgi:hypothetical protein
MLIEARQQLGRGDAQVAGGAQGLGEEGGAEGVAAFHFPGEVDDKCVEPAELDAGLEEGGGDIARRGTAGVRQLVEDGGGDDRLEVGGGGGRWGAGGGFGGDEGLHVAGEGREGQDVAGPAAVQIAGIAAQGEVEGVALGAVDGGEDGGLRGLVRRGEDALAQLGQEMGRHEAELGAEPEDGAVDGSERTLQH